MTDSSNNSAPRLVLGTMAMGGQADEAESKAMVEAFLAAGGTEIDTALMYNGGNTHLVLATVLGSLSSEPAASAVEVATKINPWDAQFNPRGGLSAESVAQQVAQSLEGLDSQCVDILYLHAPDHVTPIEETLAAVDVAHKGGAFKEFGLSNYAAWEVVAIHAHCAAKGYTLPTVYQGMYSMFCRAVEAELLPACRSLGIRFYAYNVTAGGLLTGKHTKEDKPTEGRFNTTTVWGKAYRQRFWNETMFDALASVQAALADTATPGGNDAVSPYEAALRWMAHHSQLGPNDGIILGGSCAAHIAANAASAQKPPLPPAIVDAIESAAAATRPVWPAYARGYSNCAADNA